MSSDGDEIDFKRLAKELDAAVEADNKYSRENAAKFRAVEQRVGSYEEFRDLVLASNLKPLERKDITGETKRHQPLNSVCSGNISGSSKQKVTETDENDFKGEEFPSQPQSPEAFVKSWKKILKNDSSKYSYIIQINSAMLEKVFISEQINDILGEILSVLNKHFVAMDLNKIVEILKNLSMSKRFTLSLQFLGKTEKQSMAGLFEKLEQAASPEQLVLSMKLKNDFMCPKSSCL